MIRFDKPMIGFCAYSGTGKTTLLARLLPMIKAEGLRVAVVKHAHHQFEIDKPGKDSHTFREAGADQILVASRGRMAWIRELPEELEEPSLQQAVDAICPDAIDLLLVEGFKHEAYPKIELHRCALGKPLIHPDDPHVVAFACDQNADPMPEHIPVLDINDPQGILDFVLREVLGRKAGTVQAIAS
ncbi:MAG: molybdopterin-guanine dinucleotide biosynthesis protein B [Gammaproteobacteria bacterium]